ncbi:transposase [Chloroflexi bacterium TSY]|nr:transposase [Chloroflexi bacterium TSY]
MEQILDLYAQPYDPKNPLWCYDEKPCQLLGDTIVPIEMKPGKKWRYDHHYERKGICYILIAYQPHTGQRVVQITERRRGQEYARFMHDLKTKHNPDADSLQIVQDNLNIHSPSSFYTIFRLRKLSLWLSTFRWFIPPSTGVGLIWLKLNSRLSLAKFLIAALIPKSFLRLLSLLLSTSAMNNPLPFNGNLPPLSLARSSSVSILFWIPILMTNLYHNLSDKTVVPCYRNYDSLS